MLDEKNKENLEPRGKLRRVVVRSGETQAGGKPGVRHQQGSPALGGDRGACSVKNTPKRILPHVWKENGSQQVLGWCGCSQTVFWTGSCQGYHGFHFIQIPRTRGFAGHRHRSLPGTGNTNPGGLRHDSLGFGDPGDLVIPSEKLAQRVAMKCPGFPESSGLVFLLENALAREARVWKVTVFQNVTLRYSPLSSLQVPKGLCRDAVLVLPSNCPEFKSHPAWTKLIEGDECLHLSHLTSY